jgi:hypothetical protein
MDQIKEEFQKSNRDSEVMQSFGFRLHNQFSVNKSYRRPKELEWLESLRQYKGLYDPSVSIDPDNSHVYPKITRSKLNIVLSRLHEMLFPELDRNFTVDPTTEPKMTKEIVMAIVISLIKPPQIDPQTGQPAIDPQTQQPSQPVMPTEEEVRRAIKEFAKKRAENMQSEIDDQLGEMAYPEETKKVLRSGLLYGTGLLGGPLNLQYTKRNWEPDELGSDYVEKEESADRPNLEFVRIWDWYPDMSVEDYEQGNGGFQRHIMTKHDLRKLIERKDFYGDIIKQYLKDYPEGDYTPEQWETDLQVIEVAAGSGEDGAKIQTATNSDFTSRSTYRQAGKKYSLLSFWGFIDGSDLAACGVSNPDGSEIDPTLEYSANVWLLGKRVIKAILFKSALDYYKIFYYEKDETSIFGEGLPRIMRHSQIAVSAAARMVLDNGSVCSGPQVEVNWSLLHEGTDLNSFYPRKIWYRDGRGVEAQYPALRTYNFESHIPELLSIIDTFSGFADVETCLPTWLVGEQVNNENSKQTSGRQYTITVSIKDVVKNFDAFTEKVMSGMYAWNMEFNPRQDIKGDFKCKPRGVSSLLMKEIRLAALTNLKQSMMPEDWIYIPRREFLLETLKAHDLDLTIRTEEEAAEFAASQRDQRASELGYAQLEAEIAYKRAQTAGQLTKAKKFNVEAEKNAVAPPENTESVDPRLQDAELQNQNVKNTADQEQIRRDEESHQQQMRHADEDHKASVMTGAMKTAVDLDTKQKTTEHGMKMKEEDMKIKAKQVKQQPKQPKKPKGTT